MPGQVTQLEQNWKCLSETKFRDTEQVADQPDVELHVAMRRY